MIISLVVGEFRLSPQQVGEADLPIEQSARNQMGSLCVPISPPDAFNMLVSGGSANAEQFGDFAIILPSSDQDKRVHLPGRKSGDSHIVRVTSRSHDPAGSLEGERATSLRSP